MDNIKLDRHIPTSALVLIELRCCRLVSKPQAMVRSGLLG